MLMLRWSDFFIIFILKFSNLYNIPCSIMDLQISKIRFVTIATCYSKSSHIQTLSHCFLLLRLSSSSDWLAVHHPFLSSLHCSACLLLSYSLALLKVPLQNVIRLKFTSLLWTVNYLFNVCTHNARNMCNGYINFSLVWKPQHKVMHNCNSCVWIRLSSFKLQWISKHV